MRWLGLNAQESMQLGERIALNNRSVVLSAILEFSPVSTVSQQIRTELIGD